MKRDVEKISSGIFDVLVVGGGIHGAAIAYHVAKEGYRTAIVEKNDFAAATSANSLKILHGGLRYLQHGNIRRMRHSIVSRNEMMRLAPYLVKPLPCMMPIYGKGIRGRAAMRTALFINDYISRDRNYGLPGHLWLPEGHLFSADNCRKVIPGIPQTGLKGAAVWYDALALDTERLVIEYILGSVRYGAKAANYFKVYAIDKEDGIYSVSVQDQLNGSEYKVKTRFIVNAAGPWFERSFSSLCTDNLNNEQSWALALNLVSRKNIFDGYAVALEGRSSYQDADAIIKRDKRLFFFVPWRGYTMIGTEYEVCRSSPDDLQVEKETLQKMVDEVNTIYPPAELEYEDISFYHAGLVPMQKGPGERGIQLEKNSSLVECESKGFISVKSVKYTTAPYIAHEVVRYINETARPLYSDFEDDDAEGAHDEWKDVDESIRDLLEQRYGTWWNHVACHMEDEDHEQIWVGEGSLLLKAEVQYLIEEEMACRLSDVVFRRTGLGTADRPARDFLQEVSDYMGSILGWDKERSEKEVEDVLDRYSPLAMNKSVNEEGVR